MTPHTIRLRRPWEKSRAGSLSAIRIDVPESISEHSAAGSAFIYQRRFNQPTGLDADSTVRLSVTGWTGQLESISLNGQPLQSDQCKLEVEIAHLLDQHNVIELILRSTADEPASLCGEVSLLISS